MDDEPLPKLFIKAPYHDYMQYFETIPRIIERLKQHRYGDISKISKETNIPTSNLSRWRQELLKNPDYTPLIKKVGLHNRVFTDDEENAIAEFIVENYIKPKLFFTDSDFKEIALIAWQEKYLPILDSEDESVRKKYKEFHCSEGFINDFKKNHKFSSKRCHLKRRPDPDDEYAQQFIDEIKQLLDTVDHERILNCDETGWKLFPKGILVWSETGIDNGGTMAKMSDKEQLTVLATVSAANTKLPLFFLAKGKTELVDNTQIGDVCYHWRSHTESGWMNDEAFAEYLMHIREHFADEKTIHLILDVYKAHLTDDVREIANTLNIVLHFIPAGMTDVYQPLDISIFGPFKSISRKLFRERQTLGNPVKVTKLEACQDMCRAWESITNMNIEYGWSIYLGEDDSNHRSKKSVSHKRKMSRFSKPKPA